MDMPYNIKLENELEKTVKELESEFKNRTLERDGYDVFEDRLEDVGALIAEARDRGISHEKLNAYVKRINKIVEY